MTLEEQNAYQILGVSENASPEEIRTAYEKLAERYSETNYLGSPLWDMAAEKREQIRTAYALLCPEEEPPEPLADTAPAAPPLPESSVSTRVRNLLNVSDLDGAEALLSSQPDLETNPEYIYLRGMTSWKRGWLDQATEYLERAAKLEPQNAEYKAALDQIRSGLPRFKDLDKTKRTNGKRICGTCGACLGECLCETVFESICECIS